MNIHAVLVSFKVDGNEKTNETSGILLNEDTVLITGTSLLPLVHQEKWMSSFVTSASSELKRNEHILKVSYQVFVEPIRHCGNEKVFKKFDSLESEAIGVWKCPLVSESLKKLFHDWTLGHGNFECESGALSSDDIDMSKELMSIFIILKCKGRGELELRKNKSNDDIRALVNLLSSLQKPNRGQEVEVVSTPFGNEHFMNSVSRGIISNVVGSEKCIILSDARTVSGCEGGPIFSTQGSRVGEERRLLGMVTCPLTWCRGEWVGFTIGINLLPVLKTLLGPADDSFGYLNGSQCSSDLLPLNFVDESVVLVRSKTSWGSGVVLNAASGIIITCSHVVKDDGVVTVFQMGNEYTAEVVFKSQDDVAYDLAILEAGSDPKFKNEAKFSRNPAKIGEAVIATGFPFFSERDDRCIRPSIASGCVARVNPYMLQTTSCIQSGFSGGGLFRGDELLGIIISNVRNSNAGALFPHINFIVPSSVFEKPVLNYIKSKNKNFLRDLESSNIEVQALWRLQTSKL